MSDPNDTIREYTLDQIPEGEHLREWEKHEWSAQEERFAKEYIRTGDRVKAYKLAVSDYSSTPQQTLYNRARSLLFQPWMQDYLAFIQAERKEWLRRGAEDVLEELTKIARANMADFMVMQEDGTPQFDLSGLTRDQSAAIQELQIDTYYTGRGDFAREVKSVKMKLAPKTPALELIGKNQKLFTDVLAHEGMGDEIEELRRARARKQKLQERTDDEPTTDDD